MSEEDPINTELQAIKIVQMARFLCSKTLLDSVSTSVLLNNCKILSVNQLNAKFKSGCTRIQGLALMSPVSPIFHIVSTVNS